MRCRLSAIRASLSSAPGKYGTDRVNPQHISSAGKVVHWGDLDHLLGEYEDARKERKNHELHEAQRPVHELVELLPKIGHPCELRHEGERDDVRLGP